MAFPEKDIKEKRRTWEESDGTAYRRVYQVSIASINAGELPEEGDPMPGEAVSVLGPFISLGGISFGKKYPNGFQEVILICKKLKVQT